MQVDVAPTRYGGELAPITQHPTSELATASCDFIEQHGFSVLDFDAVQDYGTQENILRTYGFIFGPRAIAHLKETGQKTIL